jgi:hypothetical protein
MMHMHRLEWTLADKSRNGIVLFSHKVPKLFPLVAHFDSPNLICYNKKTKSKEFMFTDLVASNSFDLQFFMMQQQTKKLMMPT